MSLSWPSWFTYGNTILAFPRPIAPSAPDFLNCDVRYGRDLDKKDCKLAVAAMPRLSEGTEVEWAVNHQAAQYTLPMTIVSGEKKGTCAVSIEAAGPLAHYDVGTYNPPFTIKASPFQLRGLASNVVRTCVYPSKDPWGKEKKDSGGQGGFVTDKIQNLADYIAVADNLDTYPKNSTYITVTVTNKGRDGPSPGDYDPSVTALIINVLKNRQRGSRNDQFRRFEQVISEFVRRTQNMYAGGKTTPWWGRTRAIVDQDIAMVDDGPTATLPDKMSYECDSQLPVPKEADCAHVEWSELGPDDQIVDLGTALQKVLTSNTCQLVIAAATSVVVNWRQIRVALDTLINVCLANPIGRPAGGRAYIGPHPGVSGSGGILGRQLADNGAADNCTTCFNNDTAAWSGDLNGLNALPAGINITLQKAPTS